MSSMRRCARRSRPAACCSSTSSTAITRAVSARSPASSSRRAYRPPTRNHGYGSARPCATGPPPAPPPVRAPPPLVQLDRAHRVHIGELVEDPPEDLALWRLPALEIVEQQAHGGVRDLHLLGRERQLEYALRVRRGLEAREDLPRQPADLRLVRLV